MDSKLTTGSKFDTAIVKHYSGRFETTTFKRELQQHIATDSRKTTAVVNHYGIECRSVFGTEGSSRTASNAALAKRYLSVCTSCSTLFSMGGTPAKRQLVFTAAASIPARRQSEIADPRLFGFIFRHCPPSRIFFQILQAQH